VITTDHQLSAQVSQALNFGFFSTRECCAASTNGKMSEYHAAIGLAELDGWPAKHAALQTIASLYRRQLDAVGLGCQLLVAPDVAGCYALFRCTDDAEAAGALLSLTTANIEARYWYGHGLHRQPYYHDVSRDDLSVTESVAPLTIALPVAPDLPEASVRRVVAALAQRPY
jgi:dTDP-4-amino-4,6-dideoxygalactose transaminase